MPADYRPRMRRAALAALYLLFLGLCAEASLQLFYRVTAGQWLWSRTALPIYQPNPVSGVFNQANLDYTHRTNEFRARFLTNSEGLRVPARGIEFARPKPGGTYRVMLLGASFAYGWGVDYADSFAARLEAGMRAEPALGGASLELVNAGVPSLSEVAQRAWFVRTGSSYQPDLVLQLEYGTLAIQSPPPLRATAEGYLVPLNATPAARLRAQAKRIASVFYGFTLLSQRGSGSAVEGAGRSMSAARAFSLGAPEVISSLAYFEAMRRDVEAAGARYAVLYYPLSYVVHPQDMARWRHLGVQDAAQQAAFDAALCDELTRRGIPCANGTEALRRAAEASDERLYYWLDIHWTARGNAVAAQHALEAFRALGEERAAPAS